MEANWAVVSKKLIPHLEKITNHPACMTCLRPRQGCECLGMSFTASYEQLRRAPPAFTTLTLTVSHQVSSQACVRLSQRDASNASLGYCLVHYWIHFTHHKMDTSRTVSLPFSSNRDFSSPLWADGWCITFQEQEWCSSSEVILPHCPITAASVPGYSLHTLSGGSKEGLLCPCDGKVNKCTIILL